MTAPIWVVGDGPAGVAAATAAVRRGLPTRLSGRGRVHPRGTLEILSGRAGSALAELGWYDAVTGRATPCEEIVSRWGTDGYVERPAVLEPSGLGWIIDRAWFDPLVRGLARAAGVDVTAARPETPTVLATGKHAAGSRRPFGPRLLTFAVALASGTVDGLGRRLLIESTPGGWWTAIDDGESTCLSCTVPGDDDREVWEVWRDALRQGPAWLPSYADWPEPRVRPVRTHLALDDSVRRVGDAALSVDPLSGHGLTLALEGALRCLDHDYADWLHAQAEDHARAARSTYALGGYDPDVWAGATPAPTG